MKKSFFNSSRIFILTIAALLSLQSAKAQRDSVATVHVGLIYPVSSNGTHAPEIANRFSLHAIAGVSRAETGVAIVAAANIVKQNASGALLSGGVNVVGGNAAGAQIAGAVNAIGGSAEGLQMAGFANIIRKEAKGAQLAGFTNVSGSAKSLQMAGFTNVVKDTAQGVQIAGFANRGGVVNGQVAGGINIAKKVKGIQFAGLLNIADSSDYPIAIFNFIKTGEKSIAISLDEGLTSLISFRSGGRVLYGIAGIGYNLKDNDKPLYAVEAGLGAHIDLSPQFRLNMEAVSQSLSNFKRGNYYKNTFRVLPAYRLGSHFEFFAGPSVNYVSHERENQFSFVDKYLWKNDRSVDFHGLYIGFQGGFQYIF